MPRQKENVGRTRPSSLPWGYHGLQLIALFAFVGCAEQRDRVEARHVGLETTAPSVDPARAHLPLDKIPPPVDAPRRGETKALSDRAQQQLAAAQRLIEQQRYTEASIELERALRYDPNHPAIHRMLAMLHWQAGNTERAQAAVQRALEGNQDDAVAHYLLGRCQEANKANDSALREYRLALSCGDFGADAAAAALTHYHLAEVLTSEGYLSAALGQYAAASDRLKGIPAASVSDPELAGLLQSQRIPTAQARVLEQLGQYAEAADLLGVALSRGPADTDLSLQYSRLLLKANRPQDALRVVQKIPEDTDAVFQTLAAVYASIGRPEGIIDELRARRAARPNDSRVVLRLAGALSELGRTTEAIQELESFLVQQPDAWNVRKLLLNETITSRDWPAVLRAATEAAQSQPARTSEVIAQLEPIAADPDAVAAIVRQADPGEPPTAAYFRGLIAFRAGRLDAAEQLLQKSLAGEPGFIPARVCLARVYLRLYRYDDAVRIAQRKDEDIPEDAGLELVLGEIYERLDDAEKAVIHLKAASQMNAADTTAMLRLAQLYRSTDDDLSAQRLLRLILDRDASNDEAREALVMLYLNEGKLDAASEQLEELRRKSKSAHVVARAAAMTDLVRSRDPDAFRRALSASLEANGPDVVTLVALAESYSEFEQAEARRAFEAALALDPDHEEAALGVVFADQRLLEFESAAKRLGEMLPRRPNRHAWRFGWPGASWRLGMLELLLTIHDFDGAYRLAEQHERQAGLDETLRTRYRLAMAEARIAAGRQDDAIRLLESWCPTEPGATNDWSVRLAREYVRQGKPAMAIPIMEAAYATKPTERGRLGDLVETLVAAKQFDRAAQYALGWFMEDPAGDDPLAILIIVLIQQDRPRDAMELARNRLLLTRDRERFQDLHAAALDRAKRHDDAAEYIHALISEALSVMRAISEPGGRVSAAQAPPERLVRLPNEPFAMQQLAARVDELRIREADQLMNAKRHRECESRLREWLEDAKDPRSRFRYLLALANSQRDRGDDVDSAKTLEQALALRPDNVGINNDVAYGWIDRGVRLDEADRMIRYSVSREPRQMAYLDTLAWLLYKRGQFADARKWLERAVRSRPNQDPVVLDHLGDTCWRLGDRDAAVAHWTAAVKRFAEEAKDNPTADEKRVSEAAPRKLAAAAAGREPEVAPLAEPPKANE